VTTREPNGPRRPGSEQPARARRDAEGPQPAFEHRERLQLRLRRPTTAAPRRSGAAAKAPLAFVFTCLPGESAHVKQETNGLCVHSLHPAPLTCRRGPLPVELPPETAPSPNYVHNLTNRQLELTPVLSRAHCLPPHRQGKHSKRSLKPPEASSRACRAPPRSALVQLMNASSQTRPARRPGVTRLSRARIARARVLARLHPRHRAVNRHLTSTVTSQLRARQCPRGG
jgi:hypothetical protein